jgi:hypothetical protein
MEFVDPIYDKKDFSRLRKALSRQVNGEKKTLIFEISLQTALRTSDLLNLKERCEGRN